VDSNYTLFGFDAGEGMRAEGSFLYSIITGASPVGIPAAPGGDLPVVEFEDERYAGTLGFTLPLDGHSLKVGGSYSYEPDYTSRGVSLQDALSFNQKNTDLLLGLAYSDDEVGAAGSPVSEQKQVWDAVVGVSQLISNRTIFKINLGLTYKEGYLSDPYKRTLFEGVGVFPENRPHTRTDVLLVSELSHYLQALESNLELGIRLAHSDHGMTSTTLTGGLTREFFDGRLTLRPSIRYYRQSAAEYYQVSLRRDQEFYSSDYRVSGLESLTLGVQAQIQLIPEKLSMNVGYERYLMQGTDGKTSQDAYPDAHAFTVGLKLLF
jgi:hypothetical protein